MAVEQPRHSTTAGVLVLPGARLAYEVTGAGAPVLLVHGFGLVMLSAFAMFWPQLNTYFSCMNSANTITATQACAAQFKQATGEQIGVP